MSIRFHRTGFGFDSHSFGARGTLVLGGVQFKDCPALRGHSDGDALLHAVIDALLGGAGLGDIGEMFPDTAARWKGISSETLLKRALKRVRNAGFKAAFVDITVLADRPRLSKVKAKIARKLAALLGLKAGGVNIKAKTQEGLQLFAPPGGVAVWAVATLITTRE